MRLIAKRHILANALRVAAVRYQSDAHEYSLVPGHDRIAEQVRLLAKEVKTLADAIEHGDTIHLTD